MLGKLQTGRMGAAGRREVGHGKLAERALEPVVPSREEWPYTVRRRVCSVSSVIAPPWSPAATGRCPVVPLAPDRHSCPQKRRTIREVGGATVLFVLSIAPFPATVHRVLDVVLVPYPFS